MESHALKALESAAEVIKFTVALATGTLVFSTQLVTGDTPLQGVAKVFLFLSWIALVISITSGTLAYSRIPVQIHEQNSDIHNMWFVIPGLVHQFSFILGIVNLGVSLLIVLVLK